MKKFKRRRGTGYVLDGFVFVVSKTALMKSRRCKFVVLWGYGAGGKSVANAISGGNGRKIGWSRDVVRKEDDGDR